MTKALCEYLTRANLGKLLELKIFLEREDFTENQKIAHLKETVNELIAINKEALKTK